MMVDNLTVPASRVPGRQPKIAVRVPKKIGDEDAVVLDDPETWPKGSLTTPRGDRTVYHAPIDRSRNYLAFGPILAVEDDREPGAMWVCRHEATSWNKIVEICSLALAAALRPEAIQEGVVR